MSRLRCSPRSSLRGHVFLETFSIFDPPSGNLLDAPGELCDARKEGHSSPGRRNDSPVPVLPTHSRPVPQSIRHRTKLLHHHIRRPCSAWEPPIVRTDAPSSASDRRRSRPRQEDATFDVIVRFVLATVLLLLACHGMARG